VCVAPRSTGGLGRTGYSGLRRVRGAFVSPSLSDLELGLFVASLDSVRRFVGFGFVGDVDGSDERHPRAPTAPGLDFCDRIRVPFQEHLDAPVGEVPHPSADPGALSGPGTGDPVADTLDASRDNEASSQPFGPNQPGSAFPER
jgi:hypothetical protein